MSAEAGDQLTRLIDILHDATARIDERDDAAIDLGRSDDPRALRILLERASDPAEDATIVTSAGESIGEIWLRRGGFGINLLRSLRPEAVAEIRALIAQQHPEWLQPEA
jgi:hypothetical protein